jgi:hypothetical protein|eukprot:COSAG01_NODE_747_length_13858_cov_8.394869_16_plen_82_part_00
METPGSRTCATDPRSATPGLPPGKMEMLTVTTSCTPPYAGGSGTPSQRRDSVPPPSLTRCEVLALAAAVASQYLLARIAVA